VQKRKRARERERERERSADAGQAATARGWERMLRSGWRSVFPEREPRKMEINYIYT